MEIYNIVGNLGVIILMIAYFLLVKEVIKSTDLSYYTLNIIASIMILYSLYFAFNMPSAITQSIFIFISVYGILKNVKSKN